MIRSLVNFEQITEANSAACNGHKAMFIHRIDESGNPTDYEVKQYIHNQTNTEEPA